MTEPLDGSLVRNWLAGRSLARGLPPPVEDHGGWRVETGQATESRRYVFMAASEELQALARATMDPLVALKVCGSVAPLRLVLPSRWRLVAGGHFMTLPGAPPRHAVPPGYRAEMVRQGEVVTARIVTLDGALAACGHGAGTNGVFVYDRIATEPRHRRRGLGSALMTLLSDQRRDPSDQQALVATAEGRSLYAKLGWVVRSPWTTALIDTTIAGKVAPARP